MTAKLEKMIKRHEGFRGHMYEDSKGHKTIGYGFNLDAGINKDEALLLLRFRLELLNDELAYLLPFYESLSRRRKDVLLDMAYNLGLRGLLKFKKMLAAMQDGNFSRAKYELLDSSAARELHRRYGELAEMLEHG